MTFALIELKTFVVSCHLGRLAVLPKSSFLAMAFHGVGGGGRARACVCVCLIVM